VNAPAETPGRPARSIYAGIPLCSVGVLTEEILLTRVSSLASSPC
jgi:hypothetical protein